MMLVMMMVLFLVVVLVCACVCHRRLNKNLYNLHFLFLIESINYSAFEWLIFMFLECIEFSSIQFWPEEISACKINHIIFM